MICNKCGCENPVNANFCGNCREPLVNNNQNNTYQNLYNNYQGMYNNTPMNNYSYGYLNTNNKRNTNYLSYACCIIVCVALVMVVTLIINSDSSNIYFGGNGSQRDVDNYSNTNSNVKLTKIDADKIYYMNVSNTFDVNNQNKADSEEQRANCSSKIIAIEKRITENYGIMGVNLCEMDEDYALEIEQVVKYMYEKYPSIRGYLSNLSLINGNQYIACFMPIKSFISTKTGDFPLGAKTGIYLNSMYFLNANYMTIVVKRSSQVGHFPPNANRVSPVAHEFAHFMSFITLLKKHNVKDVSYVDLQNYSMIYEVSLDFKTGNNSLSILKEAYSNYQVKYNDTQTGFDKFRESISSYAVAKDAKGNYIYDETIAEAYHDVYLNGNSAKPASKEIVAVLEKRLG